MASFRISQHFPSGKTRFLMLFRYIHEATFSIQMLMLNALTEPSIRCCDKRFRGKQTLDIKLNHKKFFYIVNTERNRDSWPNKRFFFVIDLIQCK